MRTGAVRRSRRGFTLVELIVVMLIIVILMGLLLSAVTKAKDAAFRAQTKAEMGEIGLAIESFKATYDVKYVPSYLILASSYPNQDPYRDSQQYLARVWPKMNPGAGLPPNTSLVLDGNQVLVFLLGGVPPNEGKFAGGSWAGNRSGFLNSPTNPLNLSGGVANRPNLDVPSNTEVSGRNKGPFFNFKDDRIDKKYSHYHDPYWNKQDELKSIYFYFSTKNGNDYDYIYKAQYQNLSPDVTVGGGYGQMDPFRGLDGKYYRPDSFQLISPGKDAVAGFGSPYDSTAKAFVPYDPGVVKQLSPGGPQSNYSPGAPGGDDLANFHDGVLGGE